MDKLKTIVLKKTGVYIKSLSTPEQIDITTKIKRMSDGNLDAVFTKKLRGPIYKLIVGNHRLIYFTKNRTICFINAFRKKSQKPPKDIIDSAIKTYKYIKDNL